LRNPPPGPLSKPPIGQRPSINAYRRPFFAAGIVGGLATVTPLAQALRVAWRVCATVAQRYNVVSHGAYAMPALLKTLNTKRLRLCQACIKSL